MIEFRNIGFRARLHSVSAKIDRGRLTVILGPNGAGKSTLLKIAAGLFPPSQGTVLYDGLDIAAIGSAALARRRAVLSQHTVDSLALPVEQVVRMGRYNEADPDDDAIAGLALERVGMIGMRRRSMASLSGGERQLVHLARVMAQIWRRPDAILFLDEPITHLDLRHQLLVLRILRDLAEQGVTVVAVLHDLNLAARHGDGFLLMKQGGLAFATERLSGHMIDHVFDVRVRPIASEDGGEIHWGFSLGEGQDTPL